MSELCKHFKRATQFDRTAEANRRTVQIFSQKYESNFTKYWVEKKSSGRGRDFWTHIAESEGDEQVSEVAINVLQSTPVKSSSSINPKFVCLESPIKADQATIERIKQQDKTNNIYSNA